MTDPAAWRRPPNARPWVYGHRGCAGQHSENTVEAFEAALAVGADGVELDVRPTRDGILVVLHDPTLERVTGGADTRRCDDLTLQQLKGVRLLGGESIPTIEQVLDWGRTRNTKLNVELKRDVADRQLLVRSLTGALTAAADTQGFVLLSSFDPAIVDGLRHALPHHSVARLLPPRRSWTFWFVGAERSTAIHPHHSLLDERLVRRLHRRQCVVNTYTVNDPAQAARFSDMGIDGIITDEPAAVLGALRAESVETR